MKNKQVCTPRTAHNMTITYPISLANKATPLEGLSNYRVCVTTLSPNDWLTDWLTDVHTVAEGGGARTVSVAREGGEVAVAQRRRQSAKWAAGAWQGGGKAHMLSARSSFGVLVLPTNEAAAAAAVTGQGSWGRGQRVAREGGWQEGRGREGKPLPQNSKTRAYL